MPSPVYLARGYASVLKIQLQHASDEEEECRKVPRAGATRSVTNFYKVVL